MAPLTGWVELAWAGLSRGSATWCSGYGDLRAVEQWLTCLESDYPFKSYRFAMSIGEKKYADFGVLPRLHRPRRRWRQLVEVMLMLCYLFGGFS